MHRENPRTFGIPRRAERTSLRVGQLVKLIFLDPDPPEGGWQAERMWVEITALEGGRYRGRLDNEPRQLRMEVGEEVAFGPEHVASVWVPEGDRAHVDFAEWAVVSRAVLDEGKWPALVYRAAPVAEHDSGLRVLSGDDDLHDAHAFRAIVLHTLSATNAVYDSVFGEKARVSFRWDDAACEHVRAPAGTVRRLSKQLVAHVYRHRVPPAPSELRKGALVLADDRVLAGRAPRYVYREPPKRERDSGFRVFASGDFDEFVAAGSGSTWVPAMRLLALHPRLDLVFGSRRTKADWDWEAGRGRYRVLRE